MCEVIFNTRLILLIIMMFLAVPNCKRIDRTAKFGDNGKPQTAQTITSNGKGNQIFELQAKIDTLVIEKRETDRLLEYYVSILDGVCIVLKDINIGYNEIYSGNLETVEIRGLKDELLGKIERIKKFIDEKYRSVQKLSISQKEIEGYEQLVEDLKNRLETQRIEILRLQEDNNAQRRQNFEQMEKYLGEREKNLEQREVNFILKRDFSSLEDQFKRINEKLQQEQEKSKTRYFLRITPNSFEPNKCTEEDKCITLTKGDNMITSHPTDSYEWIDKNKRTLRILDWESFWIEGKFFIVFNKKKTKHSENGKTREKK